MLTALKDSNPFSGRFHSAYAAALIFAAVLSWLLWMSGGQAGYSPDGATALHLAQNIASGHGLVINTVNPKNMPLQPRPWVTKPPLFPTAVSLAVFLGIPPKTAGLLISATSCAAAGTLLLLLARQLLPLWAALLVPLLFTAQVTSLRWGINIHEESLFVALSLATLWRLVVLRKNSADAHKAQYLLVGSLAALSVLTSYQGLPLLLLSLLYMILQSRKQKSHIPLLAFSIGMGITAIWPFLRFLTLWMDGIRPGFLTIHDTTYYQMVAGIASAFQNDTLGQLFVWLYDGSITDLTVLALLFLSLCGLFLVAWRKAPASHPLVLYTALYLVFLVVQLGGIGKHVFEPRYNMPINGLLLLFIVYAAFKLLRFLPHFRSAAAGMALLTIAFFLLGQFKRYPQLLDDHGDLCPARHTFSWVKTHVPSGAVVAATQCGYQLLVESNQHFWLPIPPARDVTNATRWNEDDFISACTVTDNIWIVLLNQSNIDPFRTKPGYGTYVNELFERRPSSRTELVENLEDGIIYRIRCSSREPSG
jgi:hypothetical protein